MPQLGFKAKKPESKTANYSKITPASGEHREAKPWAPKQTMPSTSVTPKTSMVGTRQTYGGTKPRTGASIYKDPETWKSEIDSMSNSRKAQINHVKKSNSTSNIKTQIMMSEQKMSKRKEILKSLSQEAFDLFPHKEELVDAIRKTMPEGTSDNEINAVAKTYAYVHQKKEEIKLAALADESSMNDE